MAEVETGIQVQTDGGEWHSLKQELDRMNDPAALAVQRQLELEANQARTRARLEAIDGEADEDAARRDHLRDRLQAVDDDFTRKMLAAAREDNE